MSIMTSTDLVTAEQLEAIDIPGKRVELVRGHVVVREPPGPYHSVVALRLGRALDEFVQPRQLGIVGVEAGFKTASNPDTVRGPDVWFASNARMGGEIPRSFAGFTPELVAEVMSPNDRRGEVMSKVGDWLGGGASLVWVIDPDRRIAQVFRSDGSLSLVNPDGALGGENVLPGFSCELRTLLP